MDSLTQCSTWSLSRIVATFSEAETTLPIWVRMSTQYASSSTMRWMPRTCPSIRLRRFCSFSLSPFLMYPWATPSSAAIPRRLSCVASIVSPFSGSLPPRGGDAVEHVWQPRVDHVALVLEARLLHDPPRPPVGRQGEGDYILQAEPLEPQRHDRPGQLRRESPSPVLGPEGIRKLHLFVAAHAGVPEAGASGEAPILPVAKRPDPEPVTLPVLQVVAQVQLRLLVRADAAEGRHDSRVAVHP